jgi:hypothetical protein
MHDYCVATYVWLGSEGSSIRAMSRVLPRIPVDVRELPIASADGSQTGQGTRVCTAIRLQPRKLYPHPFLTDITSVVVLCEVAGPSQREGHLDGGMRLEPDTTNNRAPCERIMQQAAASRPSFAVSQEYTLVDRVTNLPIGVLIFSYLLLVWQNFGNSAVCQASQI